ncbi:Transducin beta-like protein 3 [Auxenochlorella protothecoides]|uniref:Transducin beta-like protein 3 n=1 Tax=Auxenochlorella protothecoides TaxID=3075 RepID=A0A087SAG6_AUXPR|nr:Transducin beta-like protein 3 [Auxenochlorella protothecoides]KFM22720.1 Transducin beta-like protein 3 [Auxenochlorella protothecoides]
MVVAKTNYRIESSLEVFYTGGPAALFPDGDRLACACGDETKIIDLETGAVLRSLPGDSEPVTALAISPDGRAVFSASRALLLRAWSAETGKVVQTYVGHKAPVAGIAVDPTGSLLATVSADHSTRVWDVAGGFCTHSFGGHRGIVLAACFHPHEMLLVTASDDTEIRVWDLVAKSCRRVLKGHFSAVTCLGLSADGWTLVSGSRDGVCIAWNLRSGAKLSTTPVLEAVEALALVGNNDEVTDVRFVERRASGAGAGPSPACVAVATNSPVIRVFSTPRFDCLASLAGHSAAVLALDAALLAAPPGVNDGESNRSALQLLASGSKDCGVRVWDVSAGTCLALGEGHVGAVAGVAFSRRRPAAFLVSGGSDRLLKVWDTSAVVGATAGGAGGDGDGTTSDRPLRLRTVAAVAAHDRDVNAVAVSPDDALVASASQDRTAKLWRAADLVLVATLRGHRRGVWSVAFSPVDRLVATASADASLRIWSAADGACLRALEGHAASALRLCWVSLGAQLVSAGADGLVKLWGARAGEAAATLDAAEDKVWALDARGDGAQLVSGGGDGRLAYANALADRDWTAAAKTALERDQPRRLLAVVNNVLEGADEPADAEAILRPLVAPLRGEALRRLLETVRDWNTHARSCHAAAALLRAVLCSHAPGELCALPGVAGIVDALAPYTQRHAARLDRLARSAFLLDHVLDSMSMLEPVDEAAQNGHAKPDGVLAG